MLFIELSNNIVHCICALQFLSELFLFIVYILTN